MRAGDLVRVKKYIVRPQSPSDCGVWKVTLGILVEYKKWEKVATVLAGGELYRVRAEYVEKAGKKDELHSVDISLAL